MMQIAAGMDAAALTQTDAERCLSVTQQGQVLRYMKHKLPTNSQLAQAGLSVPALTFSFVLLHCPSP